jgi:hypothetical protein
MDHKEFASKLREVAEQMRKEAADSEKAKMQKCAKVIVAARGLNELSNIIKGAN